MNTEEDKELIKYYAELFAKYSTTQLFEIYDISLEKFISTMGRDGSFVINKRSLMKDLIKREKMDKHLGYLLVFEYNRVRVDFKNPAYIGVRDAKIDKNDKYHSKQRYF